jgi:hypothetical protein
MSKKYIVTAPTVAVTVAGALRYVERGSILPEEVDEEHIKALVGLDFIKKVDVADEDGESAEVTVPDGDPSDKWTGAQLKLYADNKGVELGTAKSKAEILAAIAAA